jgi:Flp pilus assembly protein TadG
MQTKGNKGAAAVEFAIVLPVLIVLLFGIVEFGLILYNKAVITNASREGSRYGVLYRENGGTSVTTTCSAISDKIANYTAGHLVTFGTATGVTTIYDPPGCDPDPQNPLTVTVNYQYDYLVLPNFIPLLNPSLNLSATTVMLKE